MVEKLGIEDFVAPVKSNPFLDDVKALIDAGEGKAITYIVSGAEENTTRVNFGKAANELGKTARITSEIVEAPKVTMVKTKTGKNRRHFEGGKIKLTFVLVDQHKRGKAKPVEATPVPADKGKTRDK